MDVLFEIDEGIGVLILHHPKALNILSLDALDAIEETLERVREDDTCRAIIVTGSDGDYFSAGADVRMFLGLKSVLDGKILSRKGQRVFDLFSHLGKPTLAAINGIAMGGACELALACTFRIMVSHAKLGLPEIRLGIVPGWGGTQRLPRLIGETKAMEYILSGELLDAETAYRLGLVNRIVPNVDGLLEESKAFLGRIIENSATAIKLAMESVTKGLNLPLEGGFLLESNLAGLSCLTEEAKTNVRNLLKK